MAEINRDEAYARFLHFGKNSSHFVWFISSMKFFETSKGSVFAYTQLGDVHLFALEPLIPRLEEETAFTTEEIRADLEEVEKALKPKISLFVSVYGAFFERLKEIGFQGLQVGREPFVNLEDCIPTGKSGKGVRAARNQALRSGLAVEEWTAERLAANPAVVDEMKATLAIWKARNAVDLGGFLNAVNPFEKMDMRRYFLARKDGARLEGFLVATPIPSRNSYFLEDLVLRNGVARGAGELLMLEAMAALAESRGKYASLGVISMTNVTSEGAHALPPLANFLLVTLPKCLSKVYNVNGLETFRKRFKPQLWENIHLALKNHPDSGVGDSAAWCKALVALLRAFRPRLRISAGLVAGTLLRPFRKYPISSISLVISTLSFVLINRGGDLPEQVLKDYGFKGNAKFSELLYLTITSDFLFFNALHFATSVLLMFFLIRWAERTYPRKFMVGLVLCGVFFDDLIDRVVIVEPFKMFGHRIFDSLLSTIDVGPSLWLALVLGVVICQLKRYREIAFATLSISVVLGFAFSAPRMYVLVMNLNHFLFLSLGFIVGKLRFEYERSVSRSVCRQKPPAGNCVAMPKPKQQPASAGAGERRMGDSDRRRVQ